MKRLIVSCSIVLFIALVFSLLLAVTKNVPSQNKNLIVRVDKENCIVSLKTDTGEIQKLYHSDKYWTHSLTVSPNNKYIAFIEETEPKYRRNGYEAAPQYNLVVIDDSGKLISRIEMDVKKYVWSPDGEKIAFLTFRPCDPDYAYKCPSGAWVFDISTSEKIKIRDRAYEVNWALFDSAVYLYDHGAVVRLNPRSKELESTHYKDIYFSPDGRYYLRLWKDEGQPIQLYETSSNNELFAIKVYKKLLPSGDTTEPFPKNIGDLWSSHDLDPPHGWVFRHGHYLLFTKAKVLTKTEGQGAIKVIKSREVQEVKNYIYDPSQRKVLKEFEGIISSWIGNGNKIVVERKGKILFEQLPLKGTDN